LPPRAHVQVLTTRTQGLLPTRLVLGLRLSASMVGSCAVTRLLKQEIAGVAGAWKAPGQQAAPVGPQGSGVVSVAAIDVGRVHIGRDLVVLLPWAGGGG